MTNTLIDWLLEKDNPSVRYFALRYLLDEPEESRQVQIARKAIMRSAPVRRILSVQHSDGYWVKPGSGYSPKYRSAVWQILFLAELGADGRNRQIRRGCDYLLNHAQAEHGGFSAQARAAPSLAIHCLNGNLVWALTVLGLDGDERARSAADWLAGAITGQDFTWFYRSGTSGPGFRCAANGQLPCAWGAVKALRALANLPTAWRTPRVQAAMAQTVEILFSRELARADYPAADRVSGEWFKFGFPLSYTSDVLEAALALAEAGYGRDPRLKPAVELVLSRRSADGRWALKHSLNGKMWTDIEAKGRSSKWVTLRALRVLKAVGRYP